MPRPDTTSPAGAVSEIIAFKLHDRDFCIETKAIREIRGWGRLTPIPYAPTDVLGVMDLRGMAIPIIDLAVKLEMPAISRNERSAIIVAECRGYIAGLVVDGVSDLLSISNDKIQPIPPAVGKGRDCFHGIITHEVGMICFLDLARLFDSASQTAMAA